MTTVGEDEDPIADVLDALRHERIARFEREHDAHVP
jgi:hypothetical protein